MKDVCQDTGKDLNPTSHAHLEVGNNFFYIISVVYNNMNKYTYSKYYCVHKVGNAFSSSQVSWLSMGEGVCLTSGGPSSSFAI